MTRLREVRAVAVQVLGLTGEIDREVGDVGGAAVHNMSFGRAVRWGWGVGVARCKGR